MKIFITPCKDFMGNKLTLATLLFCSSISSQAAEWANTMKKQLAPDGMMAAIDVDSILNKGNGIVELWQRHTFKKPQTFLRPDGIETQYWVEQLLTRYDCRNRKSMMIYAVMRGAKHETLLADEVESPRWEPVPPDTVREGVMRAGCKRDYPM